MFILVGTIIYLYVEEKYFRLKLEKKTAELKKATAKKKLKKSKCPTHFADHNNECRYNVYMKKFTCQFNPKHLANSGYFYNSPDICCNNRCAELNKILKVVLEERKKKPKDTNKVWCQTDGGINCREYQSKNGGCPNDALSGQAQPAFSTKAECRKFGKITHCYDLKREDCFNHSTCVWQDDEKSASGGKCVFGTPSGPYHATTDVSVGYINGPPTAIAGNTNPFFSVSSLQREAEKKEAEKKKA